VVWRKIIEKAFGGFATIDAESMHKIYGTLVRQKKNLFLLNSLKRKHLTHAEYEYINKIKNLYLTLQRVTNCKFIVDISKRHNYGKILQSIPEIEIYFLHLIRDARGVAYSWQKKKPTRDTTKNSYMLRRGCFRSSLSWLYKNIDTETLKKVSEERYLRLRYEDFVNCPKEHITRILAWLGENKSLPLFHSDSKVQLKRMHQFAGNPDRFKEGNIIVKKDIEWKKNMKIVDKIKVTMLTWPLLLKYGYIKIKR